MNEKRYKMVNTNLVDDDGLVYYLIKKDGRDVCQVFGKHTAKAIVTELNALHEENVKLQARNKYLAMKIQRERNSTQKQYAKWEKEAETKIKELLEENEQLKFENNELKCALALDSIDYILADGKKIDIPPYYEFENRYKNKKYRREEYDEYW